MNQAFPLPTPSFLFGDEREEFVWQKLFDSLSEKKISWEKFIQKIEDPLRVSRLNAGPYGRSILHLSVLDNRIDIVRILRKDSSLKLRRDAYGLSALDLAQFLDRKECLELLQPFSEIAASPKLPDIKDFEYLTHPIFETKEGFEQTLAHVAKIKREDRIAPEKIWMGIYFDKEIRKGIHPSISIQLIDGEIGYGVFADKKIPPCTFVGEYTGIIQERAPKQLKEKSYCLRYNIWEGKKNFAIDAEKKGNFTRFINHSSNPNLVLQSVYWRGIPRMIFVSLEEIREGAQLTFDYGPLFWKESSQTPKLLDDH